MQFDCLTLALPWHRQQYNGGREAHMTVFTSLDVAHAANPGHHVPLQQISENTHGATIHGVVLGTIQTAGSAPRPVAIAVTDEALLTAQQLPLGINGFNRADRPASLELMRFDDGRTVVLVALSDSSVPFEFDDGDAAWLFGTVMGEDGAAAVNTAVVVSRQEHQAAQQAQFRSEVSTTRWKIFGVMVVALVALFVIGSMMGS